MEESSIVKPNVQNCFCTGITPIIRLCLSISIPKQNEASETVLEDRGLFNYPKRVVSESVVIDHPPLFLQ